MSNITTIYKVAQRGMDVSEKTKATLNAYFKPQRNIVSEEYTFRQLLQISDEYYGSYVNASRAKLWSN